MSKSITYSIVGVLVVIILVFAGLKFFGRNGQALRVSSNRGYSAVFLTNGQVYFGKIADANNEWVTLTDIFYLQVQQQVQPKPEDEATPKNQSKLSLVKLGNELHGPDDEMKINTDHVLFTESLKEDGKVVKSITQYVENGNKNPETPATENPETPPVESNQETNQ